MAVSAEWTRAPEDTVSFYLRELSSEDHLIPKLQKWLIVLIFTFSEWVIRLILCGVWSWHEWRAVVPSCNVCCCCVWCMLYVEWEMNMEDRREEKHTMASSRSVIVTYYEGDINTVVDEHFFRALSKNSTPKDLSVKHHERQPSYNTGETYTHLWTVYRAQTRGRIWMKWGWVSVWERGRVFERNAGVSEWACIWSEWGRVLKRNAGVPLNGMGVYLNRMGACIWMEEGACLYAHLWMQRPVSRWLGFYSSDSCFCMTAGGTLSMLGSSVSHRCFNFMLHLWRTVHRMSETWLSSCPVFRDVKANTNS